MAVITSLNLNVGSSQHITANVLDQLGNIIPGLQAIVNDPGPDSSFTPDTGLTDQGEVLGVAPGTDSVIATFQGISATLPVTVAPAPPIPTSIQFTAP